MIMGVFRPTGTAIRSSADSTWSPDIGFSICRAAVIGRARGERGWKDSSLGKRILLYGCVELALSWAFLDLHTST